MPVVTQYVDVAGVKRWGLNADALAQFTSGDIDDAAEGASREMDGYFRDRFKLPFTQVGTDVARHCAAIAAYDLLTARGYRPIDPGEDVPRQRYDDAIDWLKRVATGTITPDVTDSSSGAVEGSAPSRPRVSSNTSRGWQQSGLPDEPFTGRRR